MATTKDIILCDTLNSFFYHRHAKEKDPVWKFISDLRDIKLQTNSHKIILCCDSGSSAYRLNLYPEYKSDRRKRREAAPESEKAELQEFFDSLKKFMKIAPMFGMVIAEIPRVEADDIIAYFTREVDTEKHRMSVISSDTDLLQLVRFGVRQRSYGPKMKLLKTDIPPQVFVTLQRFEEVYEMTPQQYMEAKSIAGDPGDSIYSPEGVGKETGFKLIRKYGSISEVEKNLDDLDIPRFSEKGRENLKNEFWKVHRNKELVSLLHTPEKYEQIFTKKGLAYLEDIKNQLREPPVIDEAAISEWLFESGRVSVYNDFNNWIKAWKGGR